MLTLSSNEAQSLGPESHTKTTEQELSLTKRKRTLKPQSMHPNTEQGASSSAVLEDGVSGSSNLGSLQPKRQKLSVTFKMNNEISPIT